MIYISTFRGQLFQWIAVSFRTENGNLTPMYGRSSFKIFNLKLSLKRNKWYSTEFVSRYLLFHQRFLHSHVFSFKLKCMNLEHTLIIRGRGRSIYLKLSFLFNDRSRCPVIVTEAGSSPLAHTMHRINKFNLIEAQKPMH